MLAPVNMDVRFTRVITMEMPKRNIYKMYHIDTNRINARQKLQTMNILEKWANDEVIEICMSEVAMNEASTGSSSHRAHKAMSHIFSCTPSSTQKDFNRWQAIEQTIFPDGCINQNQKNDAEIVFNADKYGVTLITDDGASNRQPGGILGAQSKLRQMGITVLRDSEAITEIESAIQDRDDMARLIHEEYGLELPYWVGKD